MWFLKCHKSQISTAVSPLCSFGKASRTAGFSLISYHSRIKSSSQGVAYHFALSSCHLLCHPHLPPCLTFIIQSPAQTLYLHGSPDTNTDCISSKFHGTSSWTQRQCVMSVFPNASVAFKVVGHLSNVDEIVRAAINMCLPYWQAMQSEQKPCVCVWDWKIQVSYHKTVNLKIRKLNNDLISKTSKKSWKISWSHSHCVVV